MCFWLTYDFGWDRIIHGWYEKPVAFEKRTKNKFKKNVQSGWLKWFAVLEWMSAQMSAAKNRSLKTE